MTYVQKDEAHPRYHLWGCMAALSSLVGRKVWIQRPYQRIHANIYVILVGPQGNRKTAARDICKNFLKKVNEVAGDIDPLPFSSESTTREQLIHEMTKNERTYKCDDRIDSYYPMTIMPSEMKEFLSVDPARMVNFLTDGYDTNYYDYSVRGRPEKDIIPNPYIVIFGCETPDWLTDRLKERVVSGGFSRRVTFLYETEHSIVIDTTLPPECIAAEERMVKYALRIKSLVGEVKLSEPARLFYNEFRMTNKKAPIPALVGFYESKHDLMLKLSILVLTSESSDLVVERNHLEMVLQMINDAEINMPRVFSGSGRNELGPVATKLEDLLERVKGPVLEKECMIHMWGDCKDYREMIYVVEQVVRTGKVHRFSVGQKVYLCSSPYLPKSVQQQLERVVGSKPGSVEVNSQSSEPSSTQDEKVDPLQVFQRNAQKTCVPSASEPQKVEDVAGTTEPNSPSL